MEAYPAHYVEHNLPLIVVSGLGEARDNQDHARSERQKDAGTRLQIESPECPSEQILRAFENFDGSKRAWNALTLPGSAGTVNYKIKTVGRSYVLPPRKAAPLPQSAGIEGGLQGRNPELHSPLSPLSPGSPVFPDGIFTPLWLSKHQEQVPSIFLALFAFNANVDPAQDELIKSDIAVVRGALGRSGYKTRFAAILIGDESISRAPNLDVRLAANRKATNLDAKTGIFFMPPMASTAETSTFVHGVLATLQSPCLEYYRELAKHARRKKGRGGAPSQVSAPATGASHTTPTVGWNVRYEVKQGIFAEFRQEMDVAEKHYSVAIEELMSPEGGVFETTANWSPRWNEARLLCDALAMRVLRCHLWNHTTNGVAQFWLSYRARMLSLLDQRGKGSTTYSWDAWEGRWAEVMAQLIRKSGIPSIQRPPAMPLDGQDTGAVVQRVYSTEGRPNAALETIVPFSLLHHAGYWFRLLAKGIRARWERASAIPEDDRVPPGQSPASAVAHRAQHYDTYLVPEPHAELPRSGEVGYDYSAELSKACREAALEFDARQQHRLSEQTKVELAQDLVRAGQYNEVIDLLIPTWESSCWREDYWVGPLTELITILLDCLNRQKPQRHAALVPQLVWELSKVSAHSKDPSAVPAIHGCLDSWELNESVTSQFDASSRLSPVSVAFAFQIVESHVAEIVECQLTVSYHAAGQSAPIKFAELKVAFGTSQEITFKHETTLERSETADFEQSVPTIADGVGGAMEASTDLCFRPQQTRVLAFSLPLKTAQVITLSKVQLRVALDKFELLTHIPEDSIRPAQAWWVTNGSHLEGILLPHFATKSLIVHPKPPKLEIVVHNLRQPFYTGETLRLQIDLVNHESDTVHASVVPKVIGLAGETLPMGWDSLDNDELVHMIADQPAAGTSTRELIVQAPPAPASFTLSIDVRYTMSSDPDTPLTKTFVADLSFVQPFDIKFTFGTLFHPDPWPSFFVPAGKGTQDQPDGIKQLWKLGTEILSVVDQPVQLHSVQVLVDDVDGASSCTVVEHEHSSNAILAHNEKTSPAFELMTQKHSLDDRRHSQLNLSLQVHWSREGEKPPAETTVAIPRLTIPASEPRVLCRTLPGPAPHSDLSLQYVLENPSAHFLTFAITMEANDAFAFSGPKYRTLSLAPLSRHYLNYDLLLHEQLLDEGTWVMPVLQVVDSYYQKNLKVLPADERVKLSATRALAVWVGPTQQ